MRAGLLAILVSVAAIAFSFTIFGILPGLATLSLFLAIAAAGTPANRYSRSMELFSTGA